MKTSSKQLKLQARRALLGNYGMSLGAQLAIYGVTMGVTMILEIALIFGSVITIMISENAMMVYMVVVAILMYLAIFLVEMMLMPGLYRLYLNFCTNQKGKIGDVFFAFKNHPWKFVRITLVIGLLAVFLMVPFFVLMFAVGMSESGATFALAFMMIYWLLIGVGTMYVGLTYGMFYYILVENPDKSVREALVESRQMMTGNRKRCFCLGLSFVGMILLGYMSLGIGFIWIFPYIICTNIQFYLDLKPSVEVYPPEWQANMQPSQWEMRPEPPVYGGGEASGYGEMPMQPRMEPGYAERPVQQPYVERPVQQPQMEPAYEERLMQQPQMETGYTERSDQAAAEPVPPMESDQTLDSSEW